MKRRRGERRSLPYICQKCKETPTHIVGDPSIGTQILKCSKCGIMDRRLPAERRVVPPELVEDPTVPFLFAVAAGSVAFAGGLVALAWWVLS